MYFGSHFTINKLAECTKSFPLKTSEFDCIDRQQTQELETSMDRSFETNHK